MDQTCALSRASPQSRRINSTHSRFPDPECERRGGNIAPFLFGAGDSRFPKGTSKESPQAGSPRRRLRSGPPVPEHRAFRLALQRRGYSPNKKGGQSIPARPPPTLPTIQITYHRSVTLSSKTYGYRAHSRSSYSYHRPRCVKIRDRDSGSVSPRGSSTRVARKCPVSSRPS